VVVERHVPGADSNAANLFAPPPFANFGSLRPQVVNLAAQLESARAEYREGKISDVERTTVELTEAVQRALRTPQADVATLQALAGSAATVRGLARQIVGQESFDMFRDAVAAFELAGSLVDQRGDLAADYGIAVAFGGEPDRAVPLLESAIMLGEDSPDVRRTLAFAYRDNGDVVSAHTVLSQLVERAPFDWQASRALAELTEQVGADPADVAAAWLNAGRALLAADRAAAALDAFTKAAQRNPQPDAAIELLSATALIADGRPDEAFQHLRSVVELAAPAQMVTAAELFTQLGAFDEALAAIDIVLADAPDDLDASMLRAQALIFTGQLDLAAPLVDHLSTAAPDDPRSHLMRGKLAFEAGNFPAAVAALSQSDQLEPGQLPVLADLGVALANDDQLAEALDVLDRVVGLSPDDPWARQTRGRIRLITGDDEAAEADLRASLDLDPGQAEARTVLGELLRLHGANSDALRELDRALDDDPSIGRAYSVRGELLSEYGQWAAAQESFRAALADQDQLGRALAGLVDALLRSGTPDALAQAERAITSALDRDATLVEAHTMLGEIRRQEGSLDDALAHLDKALEYAPDTPDALATRGEVLFAGQRIDEAITAFEQAAAAGFDKGWVAARIGEVQLALFDRTGNATVLDKAVKSLRKARKAAPDDPEVLVALGSAYHLAGRQADALQVLNDAVRLFHGATVPGDAQLAGALIVRGEVRLAAGAVQDAIDDVRAALELGDDRLDVRALLAEANWNAGAYQEALREAESVLKADATHVAARVVLGASRAALGSVDGGLADLHAAVAAAPTDVFAHRVLGAVLADAGRYDDAVDAMKVAVDRAPHDAELQYEYAAALVAAGDYQIALSALEELIWRSPQDVAIQRLLGTALGRVGRHQEAVSVWERVVTLAGEPVAEDIVWLATELARVDEFDAALAKLDSIPPSGRVLATRSTILADTGHWVEAIESAAAAIALDDANPWAHQTLGWALQHGDATDPERSRSAYAKAVQLSPDDPWAHKGLANALYLLGDPAAATSYEWVVEHLARVSPHDSDLNALLGWCLYRLSRHPQAIDCLQRAVEDPDLRVGALFDLMLAHLALGNHEQAQQTYDAATSELRALSEPCRRAVGGIGLDNLDTAVARELSDNSLAHELQDSLRRFHNQAPHDARARDL